MKQAFYKTGLVILLFLAGVMTAQSQSKDPAENQRIIESKNYVFKAQYASPQRGRTVPLTSEYDLTVAGDSLVSYLPYFGRAYSAPIDPTKGAGMFTSVKFDYSISPNDKKGKWEISIQPRDVSEVQQMFLEIFDNGTATLRIQFQNRQPMSYSGYIVEGKDRGKKAF
jgi:hypothetical protein